MLNDSNDNQQPQNPSVQTPPVVQDVSYSPEVTPFQDKIKRKNSKKPLFIAFSLLFIIIVAAGTAYVIFQMKKPTVSTSQVKADNSLAHQLSEAYSNSNGNKTIELDNPVSQTSGTKGYMNASASIKSDNISDNKKALFYQTPDSTWHFFTTTQNQDTLGCDIYNSADLINAYVGFTCLDTKTNKSSFVEQAQPKFDIVPDSISS
jgi:type II secretory pathway pseudopilin PulG